MRENLTSQLESDVNDLRFTLHHEREARVNQVSGFLQSAHLLLRSQNFTFSRARSARCRAVKNGYVMKFYLFMVHWYKPFILQPEHSSGQGSSPR